MRKIFRNKELAGVVPETDFGASPDLKPFGCQ